MSSGTCEKTNYWVGSIEFHIIRFLATVLRRIWVGLHSSIVLKLFGIVMRAASYLSLLFRYIREIASNAAGVVMWRFT